MPELADHLLRVSLFQRWTSRFQTADVRILTKRFLFSTGNGLLELQYRKNQRCQCFWQKYNYPWFKHQCMQLSSSVHFPSNLLSVTKWTPLLLSIQCQLEILVADFFSNHVLYFVSAVSSISTKWFANYVETTITTTTIIFTGSKDNNYIESKVTRDKYIPIRPPCQSSNQ